MPSITVFYGLYGSGKSEIAINYAVRLAEEGHGVALVDLDAVTPYFRVRDVAVELGKRGVLVVAPKESVRHADLPVLPEGIRRVLTRGAGQVIVDVGGDPTGARVLGGLRDALGEAPEGLFVVNPNRPFSRTLEEARDSLHRIAASSGLFPKGLVANGHLGHLTTEDHVIQGIEFARKLGKEVHLPVRFFASFRHFRSSRRILHAAGDLPGLYLERFLLKPWEEEEH